MADNKIELVFQAIDKASSVVKDINSALGGTATAANGATSATRTFGDTLKAIISADLIHAIGRAFVNLAKGITGFATESVALASSMNETISKITVVFGEHSAALIKWAESAATAMGMSKNQALTAAATYGYLFTAMGITEEASATMSQELVRLASDLASINNMDPTLVLDKLRAGLVGEVEPLRSLGVVLNQAVLETKALEMGLIQKGQAMNGATKAQAAYLLILEQTSKAQGDYARTSHELANQQRTLAAVIEDAKTTMGTAFLPLATAFTTAFGSILSSMTPQLESISMTIRNWSVGLVADFFYWGANIVQSLAGGMVDGTSAVVQALNNIGAYFTYMLQANSPPKLLPQLTEWGASAMASYFDGWKSETAGGTALLQNWMKSLGPILSKIDMGGGFSDAMREQVMGQFGSNGLLIAEMADAYANQGEAIKGTATAQEDYDKAVKEGNEEEIDGKKTILDTAKKTETDARARFAAAQQRVRKEADAQMALVNATKAQTAAIQAQAKVMGDASEAKAQAEAKALAAAKLAWEMSKTDTKGKIALIDRESAAHAEGTVEWYQLQTQKSSLLKMLASEEMALSKTAGAAGVAAGAAGVTGIQGMLKEIPKMQTALSGITMPDFLDPAIMKMSKNMSLWDRIKALGKSLGDGFIKAFIDIAWGKLKEKLGIKDESLISLVQKLGTTLGTEIGNAITGAIKTKLQEFFTWDNLAQLGLDIFGLKDPNIIINKQKGLSPPGTSPGYFPGGPTFGTNSIMPPSGTLNGLTSSLTNNKTLSLTFNITAPTATAAGDAVLLKLRSAGLA